MKITKFLALVMAAAAIVACKKDRRHEDKPQDETIVTDHAYIMEGDKTNTLFLVQGEINEDCELGGRGIMLVADLNVPASSPDLLPAGVYKAYLNVGSDNAYTFNTGYTDGTFPVGTFIASKASDVAQPGFQLVKGGTIDVAVQRGVYYITATVTSGESYVFEYDGVLEEIIVEKEPDAIVLNNAIASNYGDYYGTGTANLFVTLYNGTIQDDVFVGNAQSLVLDLLCPPSAGLSIPAGIYTYSDTKKQFTFSKSEPYTYTLEQYLKELEAAGYTIDWSDFSAAELAAVFNGMDGSHYYECTSTTEDYFEIQNGTVTVSVSGSLYSIVADVVIGGQNYRYRYDGPIAVTDESDDPVGPGDDSQAIECKNLVKGELWYCGDAYGLNNGTSNWMIYLGDSGINMETLTGSGDIIQLELNAAGGKTDIRNGTYTVVAPTEKTLVDGTAVQGYNDPEGYSWGCWYFNDDTVVYIPASSGTVTVSGSQSNSYTISFDLMAEDGSTVKGTYRGKLDYVDATSATASTSTFRYKPAAGRHSVVPETRRMRKAVSRPHRIQNGKTIKR